MIVETVSPSPLPLVIGNLPTCDFTIEPSTQVREVVETLEKHPDYPGVLIVERGRCVGMVSRQRCFERLSQPFGVEVFLRRPIATLYQKLSFQPLRLPAATSVEQAVQMALSRAPEELYEPLIVEYESQRVRLLDLHLLLLAQSRLLANANQVIQQQSTLERALSSSLDWDEVLNLILRLIGELVPYDRASVLLEKNGQLKFAAGRGFPAGWKGDALERDSQETLAYQEVRWTRQPMLLSDLPDFLSQQQMGNLVSSSWLGLPLIFSNTPIGMISLTRTLLDMFTHEEVTVAQSFCVQAAIALKNASLYHEVLTFNQDLESLVRERTDALQNAFEQLDRLDRDRAVFIEVAARELRTPIQKLEKELRQLFADPERFEQPEERAQVCEQINNGLRRVNGVIGSMMDLSMIDRRELDLHHEPVELIPLLESLKGELTTTITNRNLLFYIRATRSLPAIQGDRTALRKVFFHLLINAVEHTPNGGRINVWLRYLLARENRLGENAVEVILEDTGVGIPLEAQENLFRSLRRHEPENNGAKMVESGLGLMIIRGIVEAHNGQVWVESPGYDPERCPGSKFHVLLPVFN